VEVYSLTSYLTCKKCGCKFAISTMQYLSGDFECPRCGIPHADKFNEQVVIVE
jgi:uncharacterized paraquat-inducible protein A